MASGDTLELTILHGTVGSKTFSVQADQAINLDLGGKTSTRMVNGNNTGHKKLTAKPWAIEGLNIEANVGDGAIEFLQEISDSEEDATITWQHITNVVYSGQGSIEGDVKLDTNEGYIAIGLTGSGILKAIA